MNECKGLLDDSDCELLFAIVSAPRSHQHAHESLDDGALGLLESTLLVSAGSVGHEHSLANRLHSQVLLKGYIG